MKDSGLLRIFLSGAAGFRVGGDVPWTVTGLLFVHSLVKPLAVRIGGSRSGSNSTRK